MGKPAHEVADVVRMLAADDGAVPGLVTTAQQRYVLRCIARCRTAALGGHVERCTECGHEAISYNSCRNRHCPKCHGASQRRWLAARLEDLLPVHYFHVVFTLPSELGPLALQNKRELYGLLFSAATETLKEIAADARHLGAEIGLIAVLHTWGQTLEHHPHLHCVVPGGGICADGARWQSTSRRFFLPVKVLSRVFRGKYLAGLREMYDSGELVLEGRLAPLRARAAFRSLLRRLHEHEWVVYTKPPFGGPHVVLKYLARYTHRIAIGNSRILSVRPDGVVFRYKDYRRGGQHRAMKLTPVEFLRRFLLHVLPKGFVRIRYYGLLANGCRREKLACCRALLGSEPDDLPVVEDLETDVEPRCPACERVGTMVTTRHIDPTGPPSARAA